MFVKQHAKAISQFNKVKILAVSMFYSNSVFKISTEIELDENNIETHRIILQSRFYKLFYVLLPLQYWFCKNYINKKIIPDFKFSILHSNVLFPCAIVGYKLSNYYKCKHVVTEHWSKLDKFFRVSVYKKIGQKALNKANAITCVSESLNLILKKYHTNTNTFIVPNVADEEKFFYVEKTNSSETIVFTAIAHWQAPKNPFYFLNALQELNQEKKIPKFKLILIGSGKILAEIKKQNYNFEIEMPGNLKPKELNEHLNACDYFLHGSDFETFSVVIVEALRCGLPCVVSPVGITSQVITPKTGYIAQNNYLDWKEKILLLSQTNYNRMEISNSIMNKFDTKTVGEKFAEVYNEI